MKSFDQSPVYKLHMLVKALDKKADQILQDELDMTYSQFLVMICISHGGQPSQQEVALKLGVTPPAISRQIDILCDTGHIARKTNPDNRREHVLSLTTKGSSQVQKARTLLSDRFDQLTRTIGADRGREFVRTLDELRLKAQGGF